MSTKMSKTVTAGGGRLGLLCLLWFVGTVPVLHADLWMKSVERTNVSLLMETLPEKPERTRIRLVTSTVNPIPLEEAEMFHTQKTFHTRIFYDELNTVRRVVVREEAFSGIWKQQSSEDRLFVDFYRTGVPRRLVETLSSLGMREFLFDRHGRVREQRIKLYSPEGDASDGQYFREIRSYDDDDHVRALRIYRDGALQYRQTQTPLQESAAGVVTFRRKIFSEENEQVRVMDVKRSFFSPTSFREDKRIYTPDGENVMEIVAYYHLGKLIREVRDGKVEITYEYDELRRLVAEKHEALTSRKLSEYYEYSYDDIPGISMPIFFSQAQQYRIEDMRSYHEFDLVAQYRLLRLQSFTPIRALRAYTLPAKADLRNGSAGAQLRTEKYFSPGYAITGHYSDGILQAKDIYIRGDVWLGQYVYRYDRWGRLSEVVFHSAKEKVRNFHQNSRGLSAALSVERRLNGEKKLRYLYSEAKASMPVVAAQQRSVALGHWNYLGLSLFRYLDKRSLRDVPLTKAELADEIRVFRDRTLTSVKDRERGAEELANQRIVEDAPHAKNRSILTSLILLTRSGVSRVLLLNAADEVEWYIKLYNVPIGNDQERLTIRYYQGEPEFQYQKTQRLALPEDLAETTLVAGKSDVVLKGERDAFLYDGGVELNDAYEEKLIAEFIFDFLPSRLLTALSKEETFSQNLEQELAKGEPLWWSDALPRAARRRLHNNTHSLIEETILQGKKREQRVVLLGSGASYLDDFQERMIPALR